MKENGLTDIELFKKGVENEPKLSEYQLESLEIMGGFFARNSVYFKRIYKAHRNKEPIVEITYKKGAALKIAFDRESREVIISDTSSKGEVKFGLDSFLRLMELSDLCLSSYIPTGSVVELDLDLLPENLSSVMTEARAIIINQKAMFHEEADTLYIDYVANLWPHGNQGNIPPIFLSNMNIKSVLHEGYTTNEEREYNQKVKETIVNTQQRSIAFMSDKDLKRLENKMLIVAKKEGETHG